MKGYVDDKMMNKMCKQLIVIIFNILKKFKQF